MSNEEILAIFIASAALILSTAAVGIALERRRNNREAKITYRRKGRLES